MRFLVSAVSFSLSLALVSGSATANAEMRKAANLLVMSEAMIIQSSIVGDRFGQKIDRLEWASVFSDRQWSVDISGTVNGEESRLTINGFAWGGDLETLTVTFSGLGSVGGEPILVHGQALLPYDPNIGDYQAMDFQQVTRLGESSFWGWVFGAEIIVGSVAGGGAAVVGTSVATGGVAIGAAPWIAAGGAVAGAASLASVSSTAKSLFDDLPPTQPEELPNRPVTPTENETYFLEDGDLIIALGPELRIQGELVGSNVRLDGQYSWEEGQASGILGSF